MGDFLQLRLFLFVAGQTQSSRLTTFKDHVDTKGTTWGWLKLVTKLSWALKEPGTAPHSLRQVSEPSGRAPGPAASSQSTCLDGGQD